MSGCPPREAPTPVFRQVGGWLRVRLKSWFGIAVPPARGLPAARALRANMRRGLRCLGEWPPSALEGASLCYCGRFMQVTTPFTGLLQTARQAGVAIRPGVNLGLITLRLRKAEGTRRESGGIGTCRRRLWTLLPLHGANQASPGRMRWGSANGVCPAAGSSGCFRGNDLFEVSITVPFWAAPTASAARCAAADAGNSFAGYPLLVPPSR